MLQEQVMSERQRSKGWLEQTFTVSYGDTAEVAERLNKFYSKCTDGCVFESGRTFQDPSFVRISSTTSNR